MNKDFIKWMVGCAEEFKIVCDGDIVRFRYQEKQNYDNVLSLNIRDWCFYPLLLQRALEGINSRWVWSIIMGDSDISIYPYDLEKKYTKFFFTDYVSIDQAKEQALKYIWEQGTI